MQKKKKFKGFFPSQTDKLLVIVPILMYVFGTFMILSAEMGSRVGELSIVSSVLIRQSIFGIVGMFLMWYCATRIRLTNLRMNFAWFGYWALLGLLLLCRLFPAANGAYAWIRFGSFTIQPAEAAKVYVMILAAKFLGRNNGQFNLRNFGYYWLDSWVMANIIQLATQDFCRRYLNLKKRSLRTPVRPNDAGRPFCSGEYR